MVDHSIKIAIMPGKKTGHWIEADLEEKELAAIGYVTTQWAILEHAILTSTTELCEAHDSEMPTDATNLSFEKRLRAWRLCVEQLASTPEEKKRLLTIHSTISNLEQKRHKLAHGLWTWDYSDPHTVTAFSFRPRVEFEVEFNFEGLIKLAQDIGKIIFDLTFPGGADEAIRYLGEQAERAPYVSRSFLLSVMTKDPPNPRPRSASPPRRKRPRSPLGGK